MVFDLNSELPDEGEAFPNISEEPPDEQPFPIHESLPDLNEAPLEEEQLVGGEIPGGQNEGVTSSKFFPDHLYHCYEYKNEIGLIHLCLPHHSAC
jgi:hypothetical protein